MFRSAAYAERQEVGRGRVARQSTLLSPARTSVGRTFSIYGGEAVRRPHPRFDEIRNAWVTKAGGPLKILVKGPKNPETEAAAWDAFYVHMAKLGQPVEAASIPNITLGELCDRYGEWI